MASLVLASGARVEAEVTLSMSAQSYEVGEVVSFVLENQTKWLIQLPSWPGYVITDSRGPSHVAPCEIIPIVIDMYPGWYFDWEWDQKDCFEVQVPPGRYRLGVGYWCDDCPIYENSLEASFDIGMVPIEPTSWGRIKTVLRTD